MTGSSGNFVPPETWEWWEKRRLRYNLALLVSGLAAYAIAVGLFYAFGADVWSYWRGATSVTILLGVGYLGYIVVANLAYLLGAVTESIIKPGDAQRFRQRTFAMGFWAAGILPFTFPLTIFALLLAGARG